MYFLVSCWRRIVNKARRDRIYGLSPKLPRSSTAGAVPRPAARTTFSRRGGTRGTSRPASYQTPLRHSGFVAPAPFLPRPLLDDEVLSFNKLPFSRIPWREAIKRNNAWRVGGPETRGSRTTPPHPGVSAIRASSAAGTYRQRPQSTSPAKPPRIANGGLSPPSWSPHKGPGQSVRDTRSLLGILREGGARADVREYK